MKIPNPIQAVKNYFFPVSGGAAIVGNPNKDKDVSKNLGYYISPVQLERLAHDIKMWRMGVAEAEAAFYPHRVRMQRMYLDTRLNGHVFAAKERRKDLTLLREFRMCNEKGVESEELTKLFQKKEWFDNFLNYTLDALFYGYQLISLGDVVDSDFPQLTIVKRWNISPDRHNVTSYIYSLSGEDFLSEKYTPYHVWVPTPTDNGHSPCGYGILYQVALYEIYMRHVLGQNADFVETYAQPFRVGKTLKTNEDERASLERALQQMGSQGYAIIDPTDQIEFLETALGGSGYRSYDNLDNRCMKIVSKIVLGHADAVDSIPGKLGGGQNGELSPVQIAISDKQTRDGRFVEYVINKSLLPKMRDLGFSIPEDYYFEFVNNQEAEEFRRREDESNKMTADIFQTIKNAGGKPDWGYFTERTGIPVEAAPDPVPVPRPPFNDRVKNRLNELYHQNHS